jgi:hypothetical protein
MIIDRKQVGNKQVRTYKIKVSKKELQDVINDIFQNFKINKGITIEVKE